MDQGIISVLVLVGPTASGKTTVSLELARLLDGEIVSADSRQVYRYLDIGTAKPTREERARIPHHFVDDRTPDQPFNAGEFGLLGRKVIRRLAGKGRLPIVVGGSGLYVRSLIDGFFDGPGADETYRRALERRLEREGTPGLLAELKAVDPDSAARIDPTKPRRIIRALEVFHLTGKPLSRLHRESSPDIGFQPVQFGLEWDRRMLYGRVEQRCDGMLARGLLEEVDDLERRGYTDTLNSLNTVGYAEAFAYRRGEISSEEMVRLFKQNSRRYAKRQLTWFRQDKRIRWVRVASEERLREVATEIAATFNCLPR